MIPAAFAAESETGNVAKVGDTYYATLEEAIKAAPKATPTTIELLKDYTIKSTMAGHQQVQNIVLDLGGHTLTSSGIALTAYRSGTTLTVQNGTVKGNSSSGTLRATYGGKLILGDDLTVQGAGGGATLVYIDNGSVEVAENSVVNFVGGKLDFKLSANDNNKLTVAASTGKTYYGSLVDAIAAAEADNTVTLMADATIDSPIKVTGNVTIDGAGKTLTYTGQDRAIDVPKEAVGANVTISNLTVDCTASYCQRGINYNTNGTLTLDNVTVKGDNVTYALNMPGSSADATVKVTNSDLTGCIALNIWGANAEINVTDTVLTSVDKATHEGYAAVSLNNDGTTIADGTVVTITGGKITALDENGKKSSAVRNSTSSGVVNVSDTTEVNGNVVTTVAIVSYNGYSEFYSFSTLQDAVTKATNDPTATVKLLKNVTISEPISVIGNVTIDGNGKTLTSSATRAINVNGADGVTIKNLTLNCSGERAINLIQNATNVTLENVTATAANYTVNVASSAPNAVVTISGSDLTGLNVVNVAATGANVTVDGTKLTCNDQNDTENYAALMLGPTASGSKIIATNVSFDIKGDSNMACNNTATGVITIDGSDANVVNPAASISYGNNAYSFWTLADAIEFAQNGNTITLMRDITVDADDLAVLDGQYNSFFVVEGKTITVDLNGKTIYADASAVTDTFVVGVFSTCNNGHLKLTGNGTIEGYSGETQEDAYLNPAKGNTDYNYKFYTLLANYDSDCSLTVENGTYILDYSGDSMAYTMANEQLIVYDGTFKLGNLGGIRNGMPWIFNAKSQNERHVMVYGGSFCADIAHQYYPFEVSIPETLALKKGEDGMYTVVPAAAYVTEAEWSSRWYYNFVGYATLEEAIAACEGPKDKVYYGKTYTSEQEQVVLLKDIVLDDTLTIPAGKSVVLDLMGKTISQTKACTASYAMIANNGSLTINDSAYSGKISFTDTGAGDPNFGWGSYTIHNSGDLVVNGGIIEHLGTQTPGTHCIMPIFQYSGSTTINGGYINCPNYRSVRLWKGDMTINGGGFNGQVWVQCVDNSAKLTITGGCFNAAGGDYSSVFVGNSKYDAQLSVTGGTFATKIGANRPEQLAGSIASTGVIINGTGTPEVMFAD